MKEGLPSVLLDVDNDDAMDLIQAEFGIKGYGVIVKLWQKIAKDHGYYTEFTEDVALLFADKNKVSINVVFEILKSALKRGIFDKDLFERYSILTSKDRQEKFFVGAKRWKKVNFIKEYLLVSVADVPSNVYFLCQNVDISKENADILKTMNRNEMNRNEINTIETEKSETAIAAAADALHKYEQLIGLVTPAVMDGIDFFISQGIESSLIIRLIEYACEQGKRTWPYIQASLRGNMDAGIKTLNAYNRAQAERAENAKKVKAAEKKQKSKFNNYVDTNKISLTPDQIIADMLKETEG